jgi:chemotaxis protein CheD
MLPDGLADTELPTRYGVNAMEMLINEIARLGGDRRRLEAKAFGAAHVLADAGVGPEVPRKNARFIKEFLEKEGIRLVSSRLGGSTPVEVLFHATTGRALVRSLGKQHIADLAREENKYDLEVRKQLTLPGVDSVVLFDEAA